MTLARHSGSGMGKPADAVALTRPRFPRLRGKLSSGVAHTGKARAGFPLVFSRPCLRDRKRQWQVRDRRAGPSRSLLAHHHPPQDRSMSDRQVLGQTTGRLGVGVRLQRPGYAVSLPPPDRPALPAFPPQSVDPSGSAWVLYRLRLRRAGYWRQGFRLPGQRGMCIGDIRSGRNDSPSRSCIIAGRLDRFLCHKCFSAFQMRRPETGWRMPSTHRGRVDQSSRSTSRISTMSRSTLVFPFSRRSALMISRARSALVMPTTRRFGRMPSLRPSSEVSARMA